MVRERTGETSIAGGWKFGRDGVRPQLLKLVPTELAGAQRFDAADDRMNAVSSCFSALCADGLMYIMWPPS